MGNDSQNKPIWTEEQVAKVKRYLQSKEWVDNLKEIQQKWKEEEERQRQEDIEWWNSIKDTPYMI